MTAHSLQQTPPPRKGDHDARQVAKFVIAAGEEAGCRFYIELTYDCPACIGAEFLSTFDALIQAHRGEIIRLLAGGA
jgi:hypothetical protein